MSMKMIFYSYSYFIMPFLHTCGLSFYTSRGEMKVTIIDLEGRIELPTQGIEKEGWRKRGNNRLTNLKEKVCKRVKRKKYKKDKQ